MSDDANRAFVDRAGTQRDELTLKISNLAGVVTRFTIAYRQNRRLEMREASAAVQEGLAAKCPACGVTLSGPDLTQALVLMEADKLGAVMLRLNARPEFDRLLAGQCPNSACPCLKTRLIWNPDGAPLPSTLPPAGDHWPCGHPRDRSDGTSRCWTCATPGQSGRSDQAEAPGESRTPAGCGIVSLGGLLYLAATVLASPRIAASRGVVGAVMILAGALIVFGLICCVISLIRKK